MKFSAAIRAAACKRAAALCLLTFFYSPARAQVHHDWPMERHDAANTSFVPDTLTFPLKLAWRQRLPPGEYSRLLASHGIVCLTVTSGGKPDVVLYDAAMGTIRTRIPNATALYFKNDTVVLFSTGDDTTPAQVWRCNWKSGRQLWACSLGTKADSLYSLWGGVEKNGRFYVTCTLTALKSPAPLPSSSSPPLISGCHLVAIDFENGALIARVVGSQERESGLLPAGVEVEAGWGAGPPAVDETVVCLGISHGLYFFHPDTLTLADRAIYDGGNYFPILTGNRVLTQGWLHHANSFSRNRMEASWIIPAARGTAHSMAQDSKGKMLIAESLNQPVGLAAITVDTGKIQWQAPLFAGSVAGAKNVFVVSGWHQYLSKNGQTPPAQAPGGFYAFNATTGKRLWDYTRPGLRIGPLIISDGSVYGITVDGYLYRFVSRLAKR